MAKPRPFWIVVLSIGSVSRMKKFLLACCLGQALLWVSAPQTAEAQQGKYITHIVSSGESLYSIAKKYGITQKELEAANPGVTNKLALKQKLNVPSAAIPKGGPNAGSTGGGNGSPKASTPTTTPKPTAPKSTASSSSNGIHVVSSGESIYSIAQKYGVTMADIRRWNNLTKDNLALNQKLKVSGSAASPSTAATEKPVKTAPKPEPKPAPKPKGMASAPAPAKASTPQEKEESEESTETVTTAPPTKMSEPEVVQPSKTKEEITSPAFKVVREEAMADIADEGELSPDRKYALHRTAPIGSIVKLKNKSNNHMVFVKVVGKLNSGSSDVTMRISRSAAEQLGTDGKTKLESSYPVSN